MTRRAAGGVIAVALAAICCGAPLIMGGLAVTGAAVAAWAGAWLWALIGAVLICTSVAVLAVRRRVTTGGLHGTFPSRTTDIIG